MALSILLQSTEEKLKTISPRTAEWEARMMIRAVTGKTWTELYAAGTDLSAAQQEKLETWISRRGQGEPLAYVLGDAPFRELELQVGPGVLIPRIETEILIEAALEIAQKDFSTLKRVDVLDLGTGSGNIALDVAAGDPRIHVDAVENSLEALRFAAANVAAHSKVADPAKTSNPACAFGRRVQLIALDYLRDAWEGNLKPKYHLILANPPYVSEKDWQNLAPDVKREPRAALVGGPKGDEVLLQIIRLAQEKLAHSGALLLEIGLGQAPGIRRFAASFHSLHPPVFLQDHQQIDRIAVLRHRE